MTKKTTTQKTQQQPFTVVQLCTKLDAAPMVEDMCAVAEHLLDQNCRSVVIAEPGPMAQALLRTGTEHFELNLSHPKKWRNLLKHSFKIARILTASHADVLHVRSFSLIPAAYLASLISKTPVIIHLAHPPERTSYLLEQAFKKSVAIVVPLKEGAAQLIKNGIPEDKTHVVPYGVNGQLFCAQDVNVEEVDALWAEWEVPAATKVLYLPAEKLTPSLGTEVFIKALEYIKDLPFKAIIGGDYSHSREQFTKLWQQVEAANLGRKVLFIGAVQNTQNTYSAADLIICANTAQTDFNQATLQGQAMGKAVLASNIWAHKETLLEDKTGWLFMAHNPKKMATALKKSLADSIRLHKMGKAATKHIAERHTYKNTCPQLFNVYQKAILMHTPQHPQSHYKRTPS